MNAKFTPSDDAVVPHHKGKVFSNREVGLRTIVKQIVIHNSSNSQLQFEQEPVWEFDRRTKTTSQFAEHTDVLVRVVHDRFSGKRSHVQVFGLMGISIDPVLIRLSHEHPDYHLFTSQMPEWLTTWLKDRDNGIIPRWDGTIPYRRKSRSEFSKKVDGLLREYEQTRNRALLKVGRGILNLLEERIAKM